MRQVFKTALFLLLNGFMALASGQDNMGVRRHHLETSFTLESGSSHVPATVLNRFFTGGYISSEKIDKAESRLNSSMRAGVISTLDFRHTSWSKYNSIAKRFKPKFLYLNVQLKNAAGVRFSDDAYRLMMQGNGQFPGRQLNAVVNKATNMQWQAIGGEWGILIRRKNFQNKNQGAALTMGLSVAHLSGYQQISNFKTAVYTDTLGQQLDVNWNGRLESMARNRSTAGFGAVIKGKFGFTRFSKLDSASKKRNKILDVEMGFYDFGVFRVNNARQYFRNERSDGKTVRIENENTRLADVFGGNFFSSRRDTVLQKLDLDSQQISKWVISPFTVYINFIFPKGYRVNLTYVNLPGYLPRADFIYKSLLKSDKKYSLTPSFSLGGFDNWNLNLNWSWSTRVQNTRNEKLSYLGIQGKIEGIEALVLPTVQHGFGGRLMLYCNF